MHDVSRRVSIGKGVSVMFDKLVLSTQEKRKARASKFVAATSFLYLLMLALALVFSVVSANPGILDASDIVRLTAVPPPPAPTQPVAAIRHQTSTPQPNIYNVKKLEDLNAEPDKKPLVIPSGIKDPNSGNINGIPGSSNIGVPGSLITPETREVEPPPPPQRVKVEPSPQPAPEKQIVKLPSNVLTGKATLRKSPDYPPMAKRIRLAGAVAVEIVISTHGHVETARALSGHPLLMQASVEAARGWRFQPTMLNGVPVRVTGVITFNFTLN